MFRKQQVIREVQKDELGQDVVVTKVIKTYPKKRRKKKIWVPVTAVLTTLTLMGGAVMTNGYGLFSTQSSSSYAEASSYQVVSLTMGSIDKAVTGTGSIAMNGTDTVTIPNGLTIKTVDAEAGESVNVGDPLVTLDVSSVQTKLDALNTELSTINTALASLSGDTMSSTISATVKGRIKIIYGHSGEDVQTVMKNYGALAILSVDGYMKVEVMPQHAVVLNEDVNVILPSGSVLEGSVYSINDSGVATVLVSDSTLAVGESVTVQDEDGNLVGTGNAQINNPLRVIGTAGTIKSVSNSINTSVSKGTTLFSLKNLPISTEYAAKLQAREDCLEEISKMQDYLLNPTIKSTKEGIVKTIELSNGLALEEDGCITLTTRDTISLSVNVDELDILSIEQGMTASVTLDAISGETFTGTITKISAQGTTSNNVTTYPVKILLNDDDRFMPGMSATADIVVSRTENALLVPVAALNTSKGETFVYVSSGTTTLSASSTSEPGVRTVVKTGLSNDEYAEVLSGLSMNDQVVVVRSATSSSSSSDMMGGGMGSMMQMGTSGGGMPTGGGMPSGGGERPSGGPQG